mmetsp:Transcript_880/g.2015  ORF Transcript_880/g.2015 Transcript_880/m.2015 type:complete len:276 (-) Transcript_880:320-1147(-)
MAMSPQTSPGTKSKKSKSRVTLPHRFASSGASAPDTSAAFSYNGMLSAGPTASATHMPCATPMRSSAPIWSSSNTSIRTFCSRSCTMKWPGSSVSGHTGSHVSLTVVDCQEASPSLIRTNASLVLLPQSDQSAPCSPEALRTRTRSNPSGVGSFIAAVSTPCSSLPRGTATEFGRTMLDAKAESTADRMIERRPGNSAKFPRPVKSYVIFGGLRKYITKPPITGTSSMSCSKRMTMSPLNASDWRPRDIGPATISINSCDAKSTLICIFTLLPNS